MENFDQIFTLLAEHEGIGFNTNILETGLINILALVGILIYAGKDFLGSILEERKATIVKHVKDAENRLNQAQKRLSEAEKQLSQANLVISEIKNETIATKKILLDSDAYEAKKDLKIRFERALATFKSKAPVPVERIPKEVIASTVPPLISGEVSVLLVKVSVVFLPTKVSVEVGRVSVPVFEIVEITGAVKVLLVKV